MTPDELHSLAAPYALDALPPDERELFEVHLEDCSSCRAEVAELSSVVTMLSPEAPEPDGLRDRLFAEIATTAQEPVPHGAESALHTELRAVAEPPPPTPIRRWSAERLREGVLAAAAALILLLAGFGAVIVQLNERISELEEGTAAVERVLAAGDLRTVTLVGEQLHARLVVSEASGEAVLITEGLPVLGADETYEIWLIDATGPRSAGIFRPDDERAIVALEISDLRDVAAVGITVEPAGGSPQPTTDPILVGEV